MAKLRHPLFSIDASGELGEALTYSKRKSGNQVRYQQKQPYANSALQGPIGIFFSSGLAAWATLSDADKLAWHIFNNS